MCPYGKAPSSVHGGSLLSDRVGLAFVTLDLPVFLGVSSSTYVPDMFFVYLKYTPVALALWMRSRTVLAMNISVVLVFDDSSIRNCSPDPALETILYTRGHRHWLTLFLIFAELGYFAWCLPRCLSNCSPPHIFKSIIL